VPGDGQAVALQVLSMMNSDLQTWRTHHGQQQSFAREPMTSCSLADTS
jgi:hypothetical protein